MRRNLGVCQAVITGESYSQACQGKLYRRGSVFLCVLWRMWASQQQRRGSIPDCSRTQDWWMSRMRSCTTFWRAAVTSLPYICATYSPSTSRLQSRRVCPLSCRACSPPTDAIYCGSGGPAFAWCALTGKRGSWVVARAGNRRLWQANLVLQTNPKRPMVGWIITGIREGKKKGG